MAQCKICGERMGWMSGKAYGGPAEDIGLTVGALLGIQEVIDPNDQNAQTLDDFIKLGGQLGRSLHLAAHSRGMVPDRTTWHQWEQTCIEVLNDLRAAYPEITDDGERMRRGGELARELILGTGRPPVTPPKVLPSNMAKPLQRAQGASPSGWLTGQEVEAALSEHPDDERQGGLGEEEGPPAGPSSHRGTAPHREFTYDQADEEFDKAFSDEQRLMTDEEHLAQALARAREADAAVKENAARGRVIEDPNGDPRNAAAYYRARANYYQAKLSRKDSEKAQDSVPTLGLVLMLSNWYSRAVWAPVGLEVDEASGNDPSTDPWLQPEPCPACGRMFPKDHTIVAGHIVVNHAITTELVEAIRTTEASLSQTDPSTGSRRGD